MVTKKINPLDPASGHYDVDGKRLTWLPADDDDVRGNLTPVSLPLRLKAGAMRRLTQTTGLDELGQMWAMLDELAPGQQDAIDDMDLNDLQAMFETWQREYRALQGVSLGEASGSPS